MQGCLNSDLQCWLSWLELEPGLLSQITNFPGPGRGGASTGRAPVFPSLPQHGTPAAQSLSPGCVNRGPGQGFLHFTNQSRRLPDMKTLQSFPRELLSL